MKLIIAGSRSLRGYKLVEKSFFENFKLDEVTEIVSGNANGIDSLAIRFANENRLPKVLMSADWEYYGASAGYIRNNQMANCGDALLAIWDGKSPGTRHMIQQMKSLGKRVVVVEVKESIPESKYKTEPTGALAEFFV